MKPTYVLPVLLVLIFLIFESLAQVGGNQYLRNTTHTVNGGGVTDYYIYFPEDYDINPNKPLLLSLHGNAERGGSPTKIIGNEGEGSIAWYANQGYDFPFIVVSPHRKSFIGGISQPTFNVDVIDQLLEHLIIELNLDENNIFLTGYSAGGGDALRYLLDHPDKISATAVLAPLTNLGSVYGYNLADSPYPCLLKENILKFWHGNVDFSIPSNQSTIVSNEINSCVPGPMVPSIVEIIPNIDHNGIRGYVYSDLIGGNNVYSWFQQYITNSNDSIPPIIQHFDSTTITSTTASFDYTLNEYGTLFYGLKDGISTEPSIEDLISGVGFLNSGYLRGTNETVFLEGLNVESEYKLWYIAQDNASQPNLQEAVSLFNFSTKPLPPDVTSPDLSNVHLREVSSSLAEISYDLDEEGNIYWALFPDSEIGITAGHIIDGINCIASGVLNQTENPFSISGLTKNTTYAIYLVAKDLSGNLSTINELVFTTTLPVAQVIQINISNSNTINVENWNNANFVGILNEPGNRRSFTNLVDQDLNMTQVGMTAYQGSNGSVINQVANNGSSLNNGFFPDDVARYAAYTTATAKIDFYNLEDDQNYKLSFLSGRGASGSRVTEFLVNGVSKQIESVNNSQNLLVFDDVAPNSENTINIEFRGAGTWGYLNAIVIESVVAQPEPGDLPTPPTHLGFSDNGDIVDIFWESSTTNEIKTFNLYKGQDSSSNDITIQQIGITDSWFAVDSFDQYYFITEVDEFGNESDFSNPIYPERNDTIPPSAISWLNIIDNQNYSLSLVWNEVSDAENYLVYHSQDSIGLFNATPIEVFDDTVLLIEGFSQYDVYYFSVIALDGAANSSPPLLPAISYIVPDYTPPNMVQNLNISSTLNTIELTWINPTDLDFGGINIYWSDSAGVVPNEVSKLNNELISNPGFTHSRLVLESTNYYVLGVLDTLGNERYSSEISHTLADLTPPGLPLNIAIVSQLDSVTITWSVPFDSDFIGINVYSSETTGFEAEDLSKLNEVPITDTFFVHRNLLPESTHYYVLSSEDDFGNKSYTNEFEITVPPDQIAPTLPTRPQFNSGLDSTTILWSNPLDADYDGINIYAETENNFAPGSNNLLDSLANSENSFTHGGLSPESTYFYLLAVYDTSGNVSYSDYFKIVLPDLTPPIAPSNLSIEEVNESDLVLNWLPSGSTDVQSYLIYQSVDSSSFTLLATIPGYSHLVEDVPAGVSYYYVSALDSTGHESIESNIVGHDRVYTPPAVTSKFVQINVSNSSNLQIDEWNNANFNGIINEPSKSRTFSNLMYTDGIASTINLVAYQGSNQSVINGVANNGSGLNGGIFPDLVAQYAAYTSASGLLSLSNLNPDATYSITLYPGRAASGSRITRYIINSSLPQTVESVNNESEVAVFPDIVPLLDNTISISFEGTGTWGYLNAIVVEEKINSSAKSLRQYNLDQDLGSQEIAVYPNPFVDRLVVKLQNVQNATFQVSSMAGQIVRNGSIDENSEVRLNVKPGIYVLKIVQKETTHKLLIRKL